MSKIAILYICTGNYAVFWKGFFETFDEKFLPDTEKHYHVFTDSHEITGQECPRIHIHELAAQPWPLITLLRFHTFLAIENELRDYDYCVFFNSNLECNEVISEDEFLPKRELGETLIAARHPGYVTSSPLFYPLERRKQSKAYIPYNCGKQYCIGALIGGETAAFLEMSAALKNAINEDLKNNIIAKWHDESHLNHYICGRKDYKLLECSYCYPWPSEHYKPDYPCKIRTVSKEDKFDIKTFKGQNKHTKKHCMLYRAARKVLRTMLPVLGFIIDSMTEGLTKYEK